MNRLTLIIVLLFALAISAYSQSINKISTHCPSPSTDYSSVLIKNSGNVFVDPCIGGSTFFSQIVDFTNATVILPGGGSAVSGTGTTNFIPVWTNGAAGILGNSPNSWNGSIYTWNSTGLNCTFCMTFTPSITEGAFFAGRTGAGRYLSLDGVANTGSIAANRVTMGDVSGVGNSTTVDIQDTANSITLNGNPIFSAANANSAVYLNGSKALGSIALTNGQLLIGSTGTFPAAAAITAGTGVTVTNGAGTITIASNGALANSAFLASNYTNATAGFTNTTLSMTLTAAKTYAFACQVFASNSTAADGFQIDFAGGSATATTFIAGSNTTLVTGTTSTLAGTFSNATLTGTNLVSINGTIVVNAGGTFILRGAEVAHTVGTLSFLTGSRCSASLLN